MAKTIEENPLVDDLCRLIESYKERSKKYKEDGGVSNHALHVAFLNAAKDLEELVKEAA